MPPVDAPTKVDKFVEDTIRDNKVVIFSKSTCPYCVKVKELFNSINEKFFTLELDKIGKKKAILGIIMSFY